MKYDIGDVIKLCNENPMTATWQIIDLSTGKTHPVTGFSGTFTTVCFSCQCVMSSEAKQKTSKEVVKKLSEYNKDQVAYCSIWGYIDDGTEYTWRDFHIRDLVYCDKVFTLYVDNRNGII